MTTAALKLRPGRRTLSRALSRDARAALVGLLVVPMVVVVLLFGTVAAGTPLQPDPAAHPTAGGGLAP